MNLTLFLCGSCRLQVEAEHRLAAMNLCMQMGFAYTDFCWREDGCVQFSCSAASAKTFLAACRAREIPISVIARRGLPSFLARLAKRPGLIVGAALGIALFIFSGLFVWDVQVSGNEKITQQQVIEELRAAGFGVGSYLPGLQIRQLENRVLMSSENIGWLSINLDGTVAHVQILEQVNGEEKGETAAKNPANLIAARDGQIEYLALYRGNAVVTVGQAVKAGELLVSGLYDSQNAGFRYTRAAGSVMARTERTLEIEIPLQYEQKIYRESILREIELHFFNFSHKIFKNSRNSAAMCDIIKYEFDFPRLGQNRLPLSFSRTVARLYELLPATRTQEEALDLCYEQLEYELAALSGSVQLLQKEITTEIREDRVVLICTVSCIEDIAQQQEFEIVE